MHLTPKELERAALAAASEVSGGRGARLTTLAGGASLRRYHRVTVDGGRPPSLVVMELGDERGPEEVTKGGSSTELPFIDVLGYLERGEVAVPRLYRFDEPRGLLYLEDLGDVTLESVVAGADDAVRERYYRLAIDELVKMQRYAAGHAGGCVAFGRAFDRDLLRWELDHFREWGLEVGAGVALDADERRLLDRIFDDIAWRLAGEPRGFVHRDYQSRNLMVQEQGGQPRLRVIDFQDALLGTQAYDLVALLRDSYVRLPSPLMDRLVAYYADRSGLDLAAFRQLFDLQTVQRKLKDAGRFVFIDRVKGNPTFLHHIPTSHTYVAEALSHLAELAPLAALLSRRMPGFGS